MKLLHVVWSPRRIEQSLTAHESLGIPTAYIVGYTEHEGVAVANEVIKESDADICVLSYDDQCPTREQLDHVLHLQKQTGDVVSGWQLLGQNSPYGSATHPDWGERMLWLTDQCFYTKEQLRETADELVPSNYFAALTAVPREWLLEAPIRALPSVIDTPEALAIWPSRDGLPYDKGCCSDWTLAMDLIANGHKIWIAPEAEVHHLAPLHGVPAHKFWMAEEPQGVFWDHRPRNAEEFESVLTK